MQLNLNDPDSIVAWWKVFPVRHDSFLTYKLRASPEFAPGILEAQRRIANDPLLRSLLVQAAHQRRQFDVDQSGDEAEVQDVRRAEFEAA